VGKFCLAHADNVGAFYNTGKVTFNWDTSHTSFGKHTLKVEIDPVEGEKNTAGNVKTVTIDIKPK
jgi:hypothetical protein